MQASNSWQPPEGPLGRLTAASHQRAAALEAERKLWEANAKDVNWVHPFVQAFDGAEVAVIAELKRSSPSKGPLNLDMSLGQRAKAYELGGAAAISVLTEPSAFGGSDGHLHQVKESVLIPLLKKDFHVSEVQILQARALHASAVLLIARALPPDLLRHLIEFAFRHSVEPVVEIRSERELDLAVEFGAHVIGVNARNLETLEIEPAVQSILLPQVPSSCLAIAESGVESREQVERLAALGADAILVGSALSVAGDARAAVAALAGVPRCLRVA